MKPARKRTSSSIKQAKGRAGFVLFSSLLLYAAGGHAQPACPPGVDPVYCSVANATGGKVYSPAPGETNDQMLNRFVNDEKQAIQQKQAKEEYERERLAPRREDRREIGCADVTSARARTLCDATAAALERQWLPTHGGLPRSAYVLTPDAMHRVFCKQRITAVDMLALKASLQERPDRKPADPRWRDAVTGFDALLQSRTPCPR